MAIANQPAPSPEANLRLVVDSIGERLRNVIIRLENIAHNVHGELVLSPAAPPGSGQGQMPPNAVPSISEGANTAHGYVTDVEAILCKIEKGL